jgi:hypothetical protein
MKETIIMEIRNKEAERYHITALILKYWKIEAKPLEVWKPYIED